MTTEPSSPPSLSTVPLVGVAVNAALATIKILAGFFGNSYALIADGIESTSDIVTSLVVWGGLPVSVAPADERHPYGYGKAEALSGIVASIALLAVAVRELLDAAPAKEFEQRVRDLASGVDGVVALDKCRIRKSGTRYFVELHVEVDGRATVQTGHDIGGRVRSVLRNSPLRIADAFIHIEPARSEAPGWQPSG